MIDKPIKIFVEYTDITGKNTYVEILDFPAKSSEAYINKFFQYVKDKYIVIKWELYDLKKHNKLISCC